MKKSNSGLTRKKITVRSKKGKTYQRSVMVATARDIGKRESLHQIHLEAANKVPSQMQQMLSKAKSMLRGKKPSTGALHQMHPWEEHHLGPDTGSKLGVRSQQNDKYTPGPGSTHSLTAHYVGASLNRMRVDNSSFAEHGTKESAYGRRYAGISASSNAWPSEHHFVPVRGSDFITALRGHPYARNPAAYSPQDNYPPGHVEHVRHDPNKWVR